MEGTELSNADIIIKRKCSHLLPHGAWIHSRRLETVLLQRKLIFRRLPIHRIIEVHRSHITVHVMPVNQVATLQITPKTNNVATAAWTIPLGTYSKNNGD